jgi:hypothetical protein
MTEIITIKTRTRITAATPPHKGAVTHHQDQSIVCVNFKIKNTINKTVKKLIPDVELLSFDMIRYYYRLLKINSKLIKVKLLLKQHKQPSD